MSALQEVRKAWLEAEARRREVDREIADLHRLMFTESRNELRESGQMADHYEKSALVSKAEQASISAAELIDETIAVARKVGEKVKPKAKPKLISVTAFEEEREEKVRIAKPKPTKWQRFCAWVKRGVMKVLHFVKKVFVFAVEVLMLVDGRVQKWIAYGKAAKRLNEQYRQYRTAHAA